MPLLEKVVTWIAGVSLNWLSKRIKKEDFSHEKFIQDSYRKVLQDLTEQYERNTKGLLSNMAEQNKIIESYKGKQVNGKEMSEWQERDAELGQQLLQYMKKNLELESQLMFCLKLKKK